MDAAQKPDDKLKAAWAKFTARVKAVRARSTALVTNVEERKRTTEMEALRNKIRDN